MIVRKECVFAVHGEDEQRVLISLTEDEHRAVNRFINELNITLVEGAGPGVVIEEI